MTKQLILIRGLPGSGKSTLAKKMEAIGRVHLETDQYFEKDGEYKFNPAVLPTAHEDCQNRCLRELMAGHNVVVSNTFTQLWEMKAYLGMAERLGVDVGVVHCTSNYGSIHGVPEAAIERMRTRWEPFPGEHAYP